MHSKHPHGAKLLPLLSFLNTCEVDWLSLAATVAVIGSGGELYVGHDPEPS